MKACPAMSFHGWRLASFSLPHRGHTLRLRRALQYSRREARIVGVLSTLRGVPMDKTTYFTTDPDTPFTMALLIMVLVWGLVGSSAIFHIAALTHWP